MYCIGTIWPIASLVFYQMCHSVVSIEATPDLLSDKEAICHP